MSVLDLDVGNSRIKWRWSGPPPATGAVAREPTFELALPQRWHAQRVRISSVAGREVEHEIASAIRRQFGVEAEFAKAGRTLGGVRCGYDAPDQLGVDRWLAVVAAWQRVRSPLVVVDAGSACTVDFVDGAGEHKGGYIVPGLAMMLAALDRNTAQVHVSAGAVDVDFAPGTTTHAAVTRGTARMLAAFAGDCVDRFAIECEHAVALILCGGDAEALAALIDRPLQHCKDLVFEGLELALP